MCTGREFELYTNLYKERHNQTGNAFTLFENKVRGTCNNGIQ